MEKVWAEITDCLKNNLSGAGFQTLISSAQPLSFEDNVLTIEVPNLFSKEWIKDKCEPIIRENCPTLGYDLVVSYVITEQNTDSPEQLSMFQGAPTATTSESAPSQFNPKYTFDTFIVGSHNKLAFASSEAVAKAPAKTYNPLFIYGPVGLGKTHLLHAIANKILETNPHFRIKIVSCEKFTNDLINSIRSRSVDKFRKKYRTQDVLLVDDIQFLAKKEQTQEEFFHTFNDLYDHEKQIILTSDRTPKEIPTLEDRLRTRFEWGLLADIQVPDLETRIAILKQKADIHHFRIEDEVLHFIATQIPTNVREMEGALTRIFAYASLLNTEVTLNIASTVIRDLVGIKQEKPLTIETIQQKVCEYFNVSVTEIASKSRTKEIAYARQICMYLSRELTSLSLPKIGEQFGKRDHSTVMHACDKIKSLMKQNDETKNIINILIANIQQTN